MAVAKQKPVDSEELPKLDDFLCFAIYSANLAVNRVYKPVLDELGLTYPQYIVLVALYEQDDQTVSGLGDKLFLNSSTLTPLLKRMEAMGHLTRQRNPEDERRGAIAADAAGPKRAREGRFLSQRASQGDGTRRQRIFGGSERNWSSCEPTCRTRSARSRNCFHMTVPPSTNGCSASPSVSGQGSGGRRHRRRAETDRHSVVGIHQADRDRQVGELLLVECRGRRLVRAVRNTVVAEPRHGFRPGERRLFLLAEDLASLTPGGDEDEMLDRQSGLEEIARMRVDAIGAPVDLRDAQVHEIDQPRGKPRLANIAVHGTERLHSGRRRPRCSSFAVT